MDKQALKKHHFWILLALAIVLIPIALSGAVFGVGGAAEEKSKKIAEKFKLLNTQTPKSDGYREQLAEQKTKLQEQKDRVWKDAYHAQDGLIRWPRELDRLNELGDKGQLYFGDPISDPDRFTFSKPEVYLAEYKRLPNVIAPTEFGDGGWQKVLEGRFVPDWNKGLPSVEDAWLALEDLCVQREVLRDVQHVNQMLAEFLPVPQPLKEPAKPKSKAAEELKRYQEDLAKYQKDKDVYDDAKKKIDEELATQFKVQKGEFAGRFISPYWQLDIVVGRPAQGRAGELSFRGRLTNTSHRRQNVAEIDFKVWLTNQSDARYVLLPIQEEYLAADKSVDFNLILPASGDSTLKIYKVEQKLNGKNVPVKQVVKLELGYPSHRFANVKPVESAFSKKEIEAAPPPAAPAAGGAPPAAGADTSRTQNGIPRYRYLERSDQVRRMAVAIVMIVDQAHIQDVIRALSNSRLRFQNTQFQYERFRGTIVLEGPAPDAPPAATVPSGGSSLPGKMAGMLGGLGGRPGMGRGDGGRRPGNHPPGVPADPSASAEEENNNLVELTVYGLISLYERYPPRSTTGQPTAPGGAPAPAAPGVPPPPPPPNAPFPPPASPSGAVPPPAAPATGPTATPAAPAAPPKPS